MHGSNLGSMSAQQLVERLRALMAECTDDERTLYEALMAESEGWKMRLEELDAEDE